MGMKPIIIKSDFITNKILGVAGITLFPFIIVRKQREDETDKNYSYLINHEMIHIAQQKELWVIPFYFMYLREAFLKTYRGISFEKEAYENEYNLEYLNVREKHAWKKYL